MSRKPYIIKVWNEELHYTVQISIKLNDRWESLYWEMSEDADRPNGVCISLPVPPYTIYNNNVEKNIPIGIVHQIGYLLMDLM